MTENIKTDANTDNRQNLIGLSRKELGEAMAMLGEPAFRARQLFHWMYHRGETDFSKMTDLSKDLRARLPEHFVVGRPTINQALVSEDTTRKWLLELPGGGEIETVM
ncbi:MAG: 23S rRNA (adenine(2503)-C(2))-methyltransferase RlmN, partial [Rhodospirillaceae bacterium]|nr:23S rRNA (adenine(2503)-C(2))-methyltransferase RlmN [Rhodospirillaceae bacterium]